MVEEKKQEAAAKDNKNNSNNTSTKSEETSILGDDVVKSRGVSSDARDDIHSEIREFLTGEGRFGLWSEIRSFFTVLIFITRLPAPMWVDLHPGYLMRGMAYFPLTGTIIGIFVSTFFDVARTTLGLPSNIAAIISQASSLWITGCLHEDGLGDSADGIGGGWTRSQILKIMTDTRLGTYGCSALILYLTAKIQLCTSLGETTTTVTGISSWEIRNCQGAGPALIVGHALSRLSSTYMLRTRDYVDEAGPKSHFYAFMIQARHLVTWHRVFFATLTCFLIGTIAYGPLAALWLITCVVVIAYFAGRYGQKVLGGVMGDYLGATICLTDLVVLTNILLLALMNNNDNATTTTRTLSSTMESIKDYWSAVDIMLLLRDERIIALLTFGAIIVLTNIWCTFVGYPPLSYEPVEKEETKSSDNKKNRNEERFLVDPSLSFQDRYKAAQTYIDSLAKPLGSLGTLEDWASRLCALQCTSRPEIDPVSCIIFVADHGIAADEKDGGANCSAYPQAVTRKVLEGLECGMAGASALAKGNQVPVRVVDVGVVGDKDLNGKIVSASPHKIRGGTQNLCTKPAMTAEEVDRCIQAGRKAVVNECVDGVVKNDDNNNVTTAKVLVLGEVGIGNTTTSSALLAALSGEDVESLCDGGAVLDPGTVPGVISKKIAVVKRAIETHGLAKDKPAMALAKYGGAEIAALVGAMLEASERNIAVLVDGFIVSTAAWIATMISPSVCRVLFLSSRSTERGQTIAIQGIQSIARENNLVEPAPPALAMNFRMGEATAALVAVGVLRNAVYMLDVSPLNDIMKISL